MFVGALSTEELQLFTHKYRLSGIKPE